MYPNSIFFVCEESGFIYLHMHVKVMTDLDSILKSRDTTLPTKVRPVKAMVPPVAMHGCKILQCSAFFAVQTVFLKDKKLNIHYRGHVL